jgi:hypothetical protein
MRWRLLVTLALAALVSGTACGCGERAASAGRGGDSSGAGSAAAESAVSHPPESGAEEPSSNVADGLPDDIPIPDGLRATSVSSEEPGSLVALFTGDLEPEEVARTFAEGLRKQGWSTAESQRGDEKGVFARKKERIASLVVTRLSGKLHVELGVWSPRE